MSRVRANKLVNRAGTGAPQLTYGAEIPVGYGLTGAGGIMFPELQPFKDGHHRQVLM